MRVPGSLRQNRLVEPAMAVWLRLRLNEVGPLVALLGLSILGYGFFYLAHEVGEGSTAALDRRILLSLRNPADPADPIGPPWLEETMRDITGLGSVFTVLFLTCAVAAYLAVSGRRRIGLYVLAGWCIGAAWASLCWFVALQLQRRGEVEAPDPPPPA